MRYFLPCINYFFQSKFQVDFVIDMKLGGMFYWTLDTDDFRGICSSTKFPLLNAAQKLLKEDNEI